MADNLTVRQDLTPLLQAQSVAIVDISQPEWFGGLVYSNLRNFGYRGHIYKVNPRCDTLYDQPCYPSLADLPDRPDRAILAVLLWQRELLALDKALACLAGHDASGAVRPRNSGHG